MGISGQGEIQGCTALHYSVTIRMIAETSLTQCFLCPRGVVDYRFYDIGTYSHAFSSLMATYHVYKNEIEMVPTPYSILRENFSIYRDDGAMHTLRETGRTKRRRTRRQLQKEELKEEKRWNASWNEKE
ncbi:hypothetical protein ALC56_04953 [Trachymyrmex septentrionalis]|uniref:Uncharacterized protein n=1 Tax=Trachymyrmex septentrionalis TaxID=34720 RepID=A0A195FKX3_9HYME|nr:hypothetical protein ALC56_04953 [Trachymyrmex septentrionalis]